MVRFCDINSLQLKVSDKKRSEAKVTVSAHMHLYMTFTDTHTLVSPVQLESICLAKLWSLCSIVYVWVDELHAWLLCGYVCREIGCMFFNNAGYT